MKKLLKTGIWRMERPEIDDSKCIRCKKCWISCPISAIKWEEKPIINYDYCKGCMLCVQECPAEAIKKVLEMKV
ncbi:MAG: 4Fe-4S binding protein [Nitrososphaeria archaeon]